MYIQYKVTKKKVRKCETSKIRDQMVIFFEELVCQVRLKCVLKNYSYT